jgi:hypothetical protein
VATEIVLSAGSGGGDGFREDLPLEREVEKPIVIDASRLGPCHPMFVLRLRLFLDWHRSAEHALALRPPANARVSRHLASMGFFDGLPAALSGGVAPPPSPGSAVLLPVRRLGNFTDVEAAADQATNLLSEQAPALATWGDAMHMAIGELCDNAIQHGVSEHGAYVAADRITEPRRQFRLVIADLGIGIPEHIRSRHPEWQDDTAAIARALERGVSGTADPYRGNGFAEVFDKALENQLATSLSAAKIDIRSAKGRVAVELVDRRTKAEPIRIDVPRRGTWIVYTVTSV